MINQLAILFLIIGVCTLMMIAKDLLVRPHPIKIMNLVWPVTGLYMPFIGWVAWWYLGRRYVYQPSAALIAARRPKWQGTFIATSLCAAACVFGDIITLPIITLINHLGFKTTLLLQAITAFLLSVILGLMMQFWAIKQRQRLSFGRSLLQAIKTETFPLAVYQAGIFFTMALALKFVLQQQVNPTLLLFWFMLQIAILTGFVFSWPANRFLIKRGAPLMS
ncbi:hypothetical protein PMPD1_1715 [Paramixta manurensis]|uniref:DUF4396 domain-containing protein n=1 Tax=Paramixta manurensis TaxID=2740817 RepID=A0A6M8U7R3_9GAMM|nr:hypothetical protein PMPD1_1715 [Erwiniaceae bacterium PD-1]